MALPVVLAIVTACTSTTPAPRDLWSQPEARFIYPESVVLDKREQEARLTMDGEVSASVGYLLGSNSEAAPVESFYATELARLGWLPPDDNETSARGIRTTAELMARSWRRGELVFRLGVLDRAHPAAEGPSEGYETVYRIDLISAPAEASGT
jgi:hypothetical protein